MLTVNLRFVHYRQQFISLAFAGSTELGGDLFDNAAFYNIGGRSVVRGNTPT
jgi:hypothetical protein